MKEKKELQKNIQAGVYHFCRAVPRGGYTAFSAAQRDNSRRSRGRCVHAVLAFKDTLPDLMGAFLVVINIPLVIISYFKTGKKLR